MWLLEGVQLGLAPDTLVSCPWEKVEKQKTGPGVSCPIKLQRLWVWSSSERMHPGLCLSSLGGLWWGLFRRCLEWRGALSPSRNRHTSPRRGVGKGPQEAYRLPSSPSLVGPCCLDRVPMWQVYLLPDVKPSPAPPCCTSCPVAPGIQLPMTGTRAHVPAPPPDCELFEGRGCVTQLCHTRAWYTVGALIKVCETNGYTSERSRRFLSGPDVPASSERISVFLREGVQGTPERRSLLGCYWEQEMFLQQSPSLSPSVGREGAQNSGPGRAELLGSCSPRRQASTSWFSSPTPTQQAHPLAHGASPDFAAVLLGPAFFPATI